MRSAKMPVEDGDELGGAGPVLQGVTGDLLQQMGISCPDHAHCYTDISFNTVPGGAIMSGDIGIEPFCHQKQAVGLLLRKLQPVSDVMIPQIICGESQPAQKLRSAGGKRIIHIFTPIQQKLTIV